MVGAVVGGNNCAPVGCVEVVVVFPSVADVGCNTGNAMVVGTADIMGQDVEGWNPLFFWTLLGTLTFPWTSWNGNDLCVGNASWTFCVCSVQPHQLNAFALASHKRVRLIVYC